MPIDVQETLSEDQTLTIAANSTNYYDLQQARNIGTGVPYYVVCHVT